MLFSRPTSLSNFISFVFLHKNTRKYHSAAPAAAASILPMLLWTCSNYEKHFSFFKLASSLNLFTLLQQQQQQTWKHARIDNKSLSCCCSPSWVDWLLATLLSHDKDADFFSLSLDFGQRWKLCAKQGSLGGSWNMMKIPDKLLVVWKISFEIRAAGLCSCAVLSFCVLQRWLWPGIWANWTVCRRPTVLFCYESQLGKVPEKQLEIFLEI